LGKERGNPVFVVPVTRREGVPMNPLNPEGGVGKEKKKMSE